VCVVERGYGGGMAGTALLLVDVINDLEFDGGDALLAPALAAAPRIAALKQRARAAGVPCIYANDNWGRWRSNFHDIVESCRASRGWPVVEQLVPDHDDYFVLKPRHSAFFATPLDLLMRDLGVDHLVLVGFAADNCVQLTASDGYMRGYRITIATDCIASERPAWCAAAVDHMQRVLKAEVAQHDRCVLTGPG
jgi:nicotinamidase-related amidase